MDRKICDFCGTDVTGKRSFAVSIFDEKTDSDKFEKDACTKCFARVVRALNFLIKK